MFVFQTYKTAKGYDRFWINIDGFANAISSQPDMNKLAGAPEQMRREIRELGRSLSVESDVQMLRVYTTKMLALLFEPSESDGQTSYQIRQFGAHAVGQPTILAVVEALWNSTTNCPQVRDEVFGTPSSPGRLQVLTSQLHYPDEQMEAQKRGLITASLQQFTVNALVAESKKLSPGPAQGEEEQPVVSTRESKKVSVQRLDDAGYAKPEFSITELSVILGDGSLLYKSTEHDFFSAVTNALLTYLRSPNYSEVLSAVAMLGHLDFSNQGADLKPMVKQALINIIQDPNLSARDPNGWLYSTCKWAIQYGKGNLQDTPLPDGTIAPQYVLDESNFNDLITGFINSSGKYGEIPPDSVLGVPAVGNYPTDITSTTFFVDKLDEYFETAKTEQKARERAQQGRPDYMQGRDLSQADYAIAVVCRIANGFKFNPQKGDDPSALFELADRVSTNLIADDLVNLSTNVGVDVWPSATGKKEGAPKAVAETGPMGTFLVVDPPSTEQGHGFIYVGEETVERNIKEYPSFFNDRSSSRLPSLDLSQESLTALQGLLNEPAAPPIGTDAARLYVNQIGNDWVGYISEWVRYGASNQPIPQSLRDTCTLFASTHPNFLDGFNTAEFLNGSKAAAIAAYTSGDWGTLYDLMQGGLDNPLAVYLLSQKGTINIETSTSVMALGLGTLVLENPLALYDLRRHCVPLDASGPIWVFDSVSVSHIREFLSSAQDITIFGQSVATSTTKKTSSTTQHELMDVNVRTLLAITPNLLTALTIDAGALFGPQPTGGFGSREYNLKIGQLSGAYPGRLKKAFPVSFSASGRFSSEHEPVLGVGAKISIPAKFFLFKSMAFETEAIQGLDEGRTRFQYTLLVQPATQELDPNLQSYVLASFRNDSLTGKLPFLTQLSLGLRYQAMPHLSLQGNLGYMPRTPSERAYNVLRPEVTSTLGIIFNFDIGTIFAP